MAFLHLSSSLNLYSLTVTAFSVTINIISFRIHISYYTQQNLITVQYCNTEQPHSVYVYQNWSKTDAFEPDQQLQFRTFKKYKMLNRVKSLTVRTVKRFKMHHLAKFRQYRLNRGRDMAIFRFFNMAAAAILDF